ncbi:hypothetical protein G6F65_020420 [Rhizopus arrhizus]|nr:hypothetical protein G6F65_020420 [Rhizopus arrhizus]
MMPLRQNWPSHCRTMSATSSHDMAGSSISPERNGEARAFVAFTVTAGDAVHGQHHDLDAGLFGANHHVAVQTAVFVEVELVDLGATADLAGFLQADRAQRRHAEHRAEFAGRRRNGPLAVVMEQALQGPRQAPGRKLRTRRCCAGRWFHRRPRRRWW